LVFQPSFMQQKMKKVIILVAIAFSASIFVFLTGWVTADRTRYQNDFVRIFPPHVVEAVSTLDVPETKISIAGLSKNNIYLRERSIKGRALRIDDNGDTVFAQIEIPGDVELLVDSPYFFLLNGYAALLQRGTIDDWIVDTTFNDIPGFTTLQPLSGNSVVLRTIDMNRRKNVFVKSSSLTLPIDVLETQVDGILCTDGYLNYSKEKNRLVYVYRYRNDFMTLDTNLSVVLKGKTIDTTSRAKISVVEINGKITMAKPPVIVNRWSAVEGKFLFVNSNLIAKNETNQNSEDQSVIDVYDITDGSYRSSFYIDNVDNSRMQSFYVKDTTLYATFSKHIVKYKLLKRYFRE